MDHKDQIDYIVGTRRWKSSVTATKTWPEAEFEMCHELFKCNFQVKLKQKNNRFSQYDFQYILTILKEDIGNYSEVTDRKQDELLNKIK